jgi:hypothetical protein
MNENTLLLLTLLWAIFTGMMAFFTLNKFVLSRRQKVKSRNDLGEK